MDQLFTTRHFQKGGRCVTPGKLLSTGTLLIMFTASLATAGAVHAAVKENADVLAPMRVTVESLDTIVERGKENKEELTARINELLSQSEDLGNQLAGLLAEKETLEQKVTEGETLAADLQGQIDALTAIRDEMTQSAEASEEEKAQMQELIDDLTGEKEALLSDIDQTKEQIEELKGTVESLTSENATLSEDLAGMTTERDQLSEDLAGMTTERDQLNEGLAGMTAERDKLNEDLMGMTAERDQLSENLAGMTTERDQLHEGLTGMTAERDQLNEELEALTAERDQLLDELQAMTDENGRLTLELDPGRMPPADGGIDDLSIEHMDWASVKAIQIALNSLGFNSGKVDCIYGPITGGAIHEYEVARGLTDNSIITDELVESLKKEHALDGSLFVHSDQDTYYSYLNYRQYELGAVNLVGTRVCVKGKVAQTGQGEDGSASFIRLAQDGDYRQCLMITFHDDAAAPNLKEGDSVTVYGRSNGYYTYRSMTEQETKLPWLSADLIEAGISEEQ